MLVQFVTLFSIINVLPVFGFGDNMTTVVDVSAMATDTYQNINGSQKEKLIARYGFHKTQECPHFEKVYICVRKCLDFDFDVAVADKNCRCTCFEKKEKAKYKPTPKQREATKWRLGAPSTSKPYWAQKKSIKKKPMSWNSSNIDKENSGAVTSEENITSKDYISLDNNTDVGTEAPNETMGGKLEDYKSAESQTEAQTDESPTDEPQTEESPTDESQPEEAPTDDSQPEEAPNDDSQPEEAATDDSQPEEAPNDDSQPEEAATDGSQPEEAPNDDSQPEEAASDDSQPEEHATDEPQPEEPLADEPQPEEPLADETQPEEAPPNDLPSDNAPPDNSQGEK